MQNLNSSLTHTRVHTRRYTHIRTHARTYALNTHTHTHTHRPTNNKHTHTHTRTHTYLSEWRRKVHNIADYETAPKPSLAQQRLGRWKTCPSYVTDETPSMVSIKTNDRSAPKQCGRHASFPSFTEDLFLLSLVESHHIQRCERWFHSPCSPERLHTHSPVKWHRKGHAEFTLLYRMGVLLFICQYAQLLGGCS